MSSLTSFISFFTRNEDGSGMRDPLVVVFNGICAFVLVYVLVFGQEKNAGQTLYLCAALGLFLSSAACHAFQYHKIRCFCDQTMISWFILATPMPFIHEEPWAWYWFIIFAALSAANKWYELEPSSKVGLWVFLLLGIMSNTLVFTVGLPNIEAGLMSEAAFWVVLSNVFFVSKLIIFGKELYWPRKFPLTWNFPDFGHLFLAFGVYIYSNLILVFAV